MGFNKNNVPLEMRQLNQWVVYKRDKHPRNAITLEHASTTDPSSWCSFDEAMSAVNSEKALGPGFVFTEECGFVGIDFDKCIQNGELDSEVEPIIRRFKSYTERSLSGAGLHVIVKGKKPTTRCRKGNIEIYEKDRYFAMTGNLRQGQGAIKEEQKALDWLCEQTFGETNEQGKAESVVVDDLILDPNAEAPVDKVNALCEANPQFNTAWHHRHKPQKDFSTYDHEIACCTIEDGWPDQEIADAIIEFRRTYGDEDNCEKALRKDYIPRTIAEAKSISSSSVLKLLPFIVNKVNQYGKDNCARIGMVIDGVGEICMGTTEDYISPRKAFAKLLEARLIPPKAVMAKWLDVVRALQPLMEIIITVSREELCRAWIGEYINSRVAVPRIESMEDMDGISEVFGSGQNQMAVDNERRLYLRIDDAARYSMVHSGLRGVSPRTIAPDIISLGFYKREYRIMDKDRERRRQVTLWISEPGFVDEGSL